MLFQATVYYTGLLYRAIIYYTGLLYKAYTGLGYYLLYRAIIQGYYTGLLSIIQGYYTEGYYTGLLSIIQGYYRLGVAYQGLDQYEDAMAAYADGLVSDPKQASMLHGLIEAMLKSSYRGKLISLLYNYCKSIKLHSIM